jgi:hypothetical protein
VVVGAIISDQLRRRDDVARVLGAPIGLSTGPIKLSRLRPGRRGLAAAQDRDIQRIAAYLGNAVAPDPAGPVSLVVVPVDDAQVPALSLVSLAVSCAHQGLRTVVADLCPGAPAARLLKASGAGIHEVSEAGASLTVVIPERDDVPIAGPLRKTHWAQVDQTVATACKSADVLLTMSPVDPAMGADHLAGWATSAVPVVTAGRSSAERVFAVGELLRLAGLKSVSAVLIGTDSNDQSLGVVPASAAASYAANGTMNGALSGGSGYLAITDRRLEPDTGAQAAIGNGAGGS